MTKRDLVVKIAADTNLIQSDVANVVQKTLDYIALIVVFIGAVNWGLIGLFRLDLVRLIFGDMTWISRIIYVLVGICGIYLLTFLGRVDQEA